MGVDLESRIKLIDDLVAHWEENVEHFDLDLYRRTFQFVSAALRGDERKLTELLEEK